MLKCKVTQYAYRGRLPIFPEGRTGGKQVHIRLKQNAAKVILQKFTLTALSVLVQRAGTRPVIPEWNRGKDLIRKMLASVPGSQVTRTQRQESYR